MNLFDTRAQNQKLRQYQVEHQLEAEGRPGTEFHNKVGLSTGPS